MAGNRSGRSGYDGRDAANASGARSAAAGSPDDTEMANSPGGMDDDVHGPPGLTLWPHRADMPERTSANEDDEQRRRKQLEITCRVLANTVVQQLVDSGCGAGQLIDFASEVLRCVTDRGLGNGPEGESPAPSAAARALPVTYRAEPAAAGGHTIHGSRIVLRPLDVADEELLAVWAAEEQIQKTFAEGLLAHLLANLPNVVADPARRDMVIRNEDGRDIGLVDLFHIDSRIHQAEMAKLLGDAEMRGRGYAKEATYLLLGYAFHELGLRRVYLRTAGFNLHNIKLNEKIGFRFEGILRGAHLLAGEIIDVALMSILREEYDQIVRLDRRGGP